MSAALSRGEIAFVCGGITTDVRADGRARLDWRPFTLQTQLFAQTNGSARIRLDATDILVGVKAELGVPDEREPSRGRLVVNVELNSTVGDGTESAETRQLNSEYARVLTRVLTESGALDLGALCLVEGKQCWVLWLDVIVLDSAGNLLDAMMLALHAALAVTRLPRVTVVPGDTPDTFDLQVSEETFSLDVARVPLCVTLSTVASLDLPIVDATLAEEACPGARVTIALNREGRVCALHHSRGVVAGAALGQMLAAAQSLARQLFATLDALLQRDLALAKNKSHRAAPAF